MTDYTRLKALAEAARDAQADAPWPEIDDSDMEDGVQYTATMDVCAPVLRMMLAADPTTVLGLIAEVERLRAASLPRPSDGPLIAVLCDDRSRLVGATIYNTTENVTVARSGDMRIDPEGITFSFHVLRNAVRGLRADVERLTRERNVLRLDFANACSVGRLAHARCDALLAERDEAITRAERAEAALAERPDITRADAALWKHMRISDLCPSALVEPTRAAILALKAHAIGIPADDKETP